MSEKTAKIDLLLQVIAEVVDARVEYLHEMRYENHRHASKIRQQKYEPAMNKLKNILESIDDIRS